MPSGTFERPEEYDVNDRETDIARMFMLVRRLNALYYEAENNAECDHNTLETYVNGLMYNALQIEKRIKKISVHKPTPNMPVEGRGGGRQVIEKLKNSYNTYYRHFREEVLQRINN